MPRLRSLALLLAALLAAACDDPSQALHPEQVQRQGIFMILDPDHTVQVAVAKPVGIGGQLFGLKSQLAGPGVSLSWTPSSPKMPGDCVERYGLLIQGGNEEPYCMKFAFRPAFGATYRLDSSAEGYPSVTAQTTVPGDFSITSAAGSGNPAGSSGLQASWTPSAGAYRYVVSLRPATPSDCARWATCLGWHTVVEGTTLSTTVPADALQEAGTGPWELDVYAMDKAVYEFLFTGTQGELFSVPPVENVKGGHGAVGSWVRRSRPLQ